MTDGEKVGLLERAVAFAAEAHSGTFRKATRIPYIVHPMEAAAIVATLTDDEEVLAAAVLHDVIEDTGHSAAEIAERFGERVARLVLAESENKRTEQSATSTWKVRKQETLDFLNGTLRGAPCEDLDGALRGFFRPATREEKMIALGDKLSNMREIYRDYLAIGDEVWERFNQKDKAEHEWYYRGVLEALRGEFGESLAWKEYERLVEGVWG